MKILGNNIEILNRTLDSLWLRNKVINHNIANVNTPNYKRLTVNFEDKLKEAMANRIKLNITNEKHITRDRDLSQMKPSITVDRSRSYRFDGNNVNIDVESAELAKNSIMYNAVVNQITSEFDRLKNAISEGSK